MLQATPKPVADFVNGLRSNRDVADYRYIPPTPPQYAELSMHSAVREVLARTGIKRFWRHQVEAITALRRGENVVAMTPTASGKSLIYNVPVLESLLDDPHAKALYVFPLKGLEQDQVTNLNELFRALGIGPEKKPRERTSLWPAEVYDGDTSGYRRKKIRERPPRVIFTNPDMLHLAINPFHSKWSEFFRHLKYVVIDEIHAYRGVFGSNAAHVFRRLRRVCDYHGARPRFVAASATIANPRDLAETLVGVPFREVVHSGAPQGGKHFFFVRPGGSPYTEATALFLTSLRAGLRTIVFTKARKITELIYAWAADRAGDLAARISPYRAGFLPRERRLIEQRLFHGDLLGVVSTSALELGVDIGGLDVCVMVGYPGSIASTWQRAGRVGRHGEESVIILVAINDALDQYFMRHPEAFFTKSHEAVVIDPHNPELLKRHLPCAAQEVYLRDSDPVYDINELRPLLDELVAAGVLNLGRRGDIWFSRRRRPQREVGIRSVGDPYAVVLGGGAKIGEIDASRVQREAFPGAIYLHQGRQYRITRLDWQNRKAECRAVHVSYYTQALTRDETSVLHERAKRTLPGVTAYWGRLRIAHRVVGFDKRRFFDGKTISRQPMVMPPSLFDTEGLWLPLGLRAMTSITAAGFDLAGTLHAVEHAAIKCLPLFALCDKGDLGGLSYPLYPAFGRAAIFVYDGYEGGIGFSRRAFEMLDEWLQASLELVTECPCEEGCPACVQDPQCGSANEPLDKQGAVFLLRTFLGRS